MKITKLFAVVALMSAPALAETQHDKHETKVAAPKKGDKPDTAKPVAPTPAPGMVAPTEPRVTPNGRPACGNVMGKGDKHKDCVSQGPALPDRAAPPKGGAE